MLIGLVVWLIPGAGDGARSCSLAAGESPHQIVGLVDAHRRQHGGHIPCGMRVKSGSEGRAGLSHATDDKHVPPRCPARLCVTQSQTRPDARVFDFFAVLRDDVPEPADSGTVISDTSLSLSAKASMNASVSDWRHCESSTPSSLGMLKSPE